MKKLLKYILIAIIFIFIFSSVCNCIMYRGNLFNHYDLSGRSTVYKISFFEKPVVFPFTEDRQVLGLFIKLHEKMYPPTYGMRDSQLTFDVENLMTVVFMNLLCGIAVGLLWYFTGKFIISARYLIRGGMIGFLLVSLAGSFLYFFAISSSCRVFQPDCDLGSIGAAIETLLLYPALTIVGGIIGAIIGILKDRKENRLAKSSGL